MRYNRFFEAGLFFLPTVFAWWLFGKGYSWRDRFIGIGWMVAWAALLRFLPFHVPSVVRSMVFMASTLSGLLMLATWAFGQAKKTVNDTRGDLLRDESDQEFIQMIESGALPDIQDEAFPKEQGEFIVYREQCDFFEPRTSGKSFSTGRSWKSAWSQRSTFRGESVKDMTESLQKVDQGVVYMTNRRFVYLGEIRTLEVRHEDILRVQVVATTLAAVSLRRRAKPVAVDVPNPWKVAGFHRYLAAERPQTAVLTNQGR